METYGFIGAEFMELLACLHSMAQARDISMGSWPTNWFRKWTVQLGAVTARNVARSIDEAVATQHLHLQVAEQGNEQHQVVD